LNLELFESGGNDYAEEIDDLRTKRLSPLGSTRTLEYFIREYLEERAELEGENYDDYYFYINEEGKVIKDLEKAMDVLKPVLKWEPQKFYWDFQKMGDGEIASIALSKEQTDTCLNILPGGLGSLNKMWRNLGNILLYLSMGYSIEVIADKLIKNHGVTLKSGLPGVKNVVAKFIIDNFGGIQNAYAMTVDKVVSSLDGNFEDNVIHEAYKHYFESSKYTKYSDFNQINYLKLVYDGKMPREMVQSLHIPLETIRKYIRVFIRENFPYLELTDKFHEKQIISLFRKYILAPIFLQSFIDNEIPIMEIADLFPGMGKAYPRKAMKSIYRMLPGAIELGCTLSQMNAMLSERPFADQEDFENSLSGVDDIEGLMKAYVSGEIDGISLFEQYEIARLAPKIQTYYKMGLPPSFIIKMIPHFATEADLISWTKKVFKLTRPYSSISPEEFFLLNTWDEADFLRQWSVRLTPIISYLGRNYYLSNI